MEGFVQHSGAFWAIQGHVLMIRSSNLVVLNTKAMTYELPWAFSDEGTCYQFAHPMNEKERAEHAWLYHRMEGLKAVDNEPEPPHNPGPQAA